MIRKAFASTLMIVAALASPRALAANVDVNVICCSFSPPSVTIDAGDTVTWRWMDTFTTHTTTSGTGPTDPAVGSLFDAPLDSVNTTFVYQFNTSGTFPYFCRPHVTFGMRGTVVVRCDSGDVNAAGTGRQDVLTVNAQTGTVTVPTNSPITLALASSNGGPANANYALWAWPGSTPNNRQLIVHGANIGCVFDPTPLHGGTPQAAKCLHSPAFARACTGRPTLPSPATTPWSRTKAAGFLQPITFTFQALLQDNASGNAQNASVSNVVTLQVQ